MTSKRQYLRADGRVVSGSTVMWTTGDSTVVILRDRIDQGVRLVAEAWRRCDGDRDDWRSLGFHHRRGLAADHT